MSSPIPAEDRLLNENLGGNVAFYETIYWKNKNPVARPTLVCHVDEPLDAERVQGGGEVESDSGGHEERQTDPVDRVPGAGHSRLVPLTAVEQGNIRVHQPEFILKLHSYIIYTEL